MMCVKSKMIPLINFHPIKSLRAVMTAGIWPCLSALTGVQAFPLNTSSSLTHPPGHDLMEGAPVGLFFCQEQRGETQQSWSKFCPRLVSCCYCAVLLTALVPCADIVLEFLFPLPLSAIFTDLNCSIILLLILVLSFVHVPTFSPSWPARDSSCSCCNCLWLWSLYLSPWLFFKSWIINCLVIKLRLAP